MNPVKKHYWFHKPTEEHPETPDLTTPKDVYVICVHELETFLKYDGREIDFDARFELCRWHEPGDRTRLLRFNCPINKFVLIPSKVRYTYLTPSIQDLDEKLVKHQVELLELNRLDMTTVSKHNATFKSSFPLTIKHLVLINCEVNEGPLMHYLDPHIHSDYHLQTVKIINCLLGDKDIYCITLALENNYTIKALNIIGKYPYKPRGLYYGQLYPESAPISRELSLIKIECYVERNVQGYKRCRDVALLLLLVKRFETGTVLDIINMDIVRILAKMIWASRGQKMWCDPVCIDFDELAEQELPPALKY